MEETPDRLHLKKAETVTDREGRMIKIVDKFPVRDCPARDIIPVRAGYIKCSPNYVYGPFTRDSWTVQYVCSGQGQIQKGEAIRTVYPTQCFILRPGEQVTLTAPPTNTWTYVWIGFRSAVPLPRLWHEQDVFPAPELEELFLEIANCNQPANRPLEELLISYIWRLIFCFKRLESAPEIDSHSTEHYVDQACRYIHADYASVTVGQLARSLNLNRSYLSRIFKESTGLSLQSYICNVKMQTARDLLLAGHTVTQTASLAGYSDVPSFSRAFRSYFRLSPRQYLQEKRM